MIPTNRPNHPGEFIKEDILKGFSLTQEQLAIKLGVSRRTVNQIINEKSRINISLAIRLAKFTKTSPELWLNLQMAVDLWDAYHSSDYKNVEIVQPYAA